VELDPIRAVIYVTEKDYASLDPGQSVTPTTDAFPGEVFTGTVARVSPVFRQTSRQARVELTIANSQRRLKPGMFVRVEAILDRADMTLSLGRMTWPHQIVRILLAEQLYRAVTILSGHPYHRS